MTMRAMANKDQPTPDRSETDSLSVCADTLDRLFTIYYDRIFAFCLHRLFTRQAAEEVASNVFCTVAQKFHTFRGAGEEALVAWLYAIAVNHCRTWQRRTRRRRVLFEQYRAGRPAEAAPENPDASDWPRLYAAVASLREKEQTVITLRFFEDMPYEQIAAVTGKSVNAVRVILHRGLKKLQTRLESDFSNADR